MVEASIGIVARHGHRSGDQFDALVSVLQAHFVEAFAHNGPYLFTVDTAGDLFDLYLAHLSPEDRQHHQCHACKAFMRRYGALASVNHDGTLVPAVWAINGFPDDGTAWRADAVPEPYRGAIATLGRAVARGTITGVALFAEPVWGTPQTGDWSHFALRPPESVRFRPTGILSASQTAAAKREDYGTLQHGLAEFDRATVAQALTLLEAESLYRSEKVIGPARFLLELHDARSCVHGRQRDNLTWRAVASAPVGWCQPRSTMIGTLLEDIAAGLDFAEIKRRFSAKMNPLQYRRPQAAPAAGTIAQAEKLVETLGIASALRRRFARLDEIPTLWTPQPRQQPEAKGGLFGHLLAKGAVPVGPLLMPAQTITWTKFARTVLPNALHIEVWLSGSMNLCAILTAADPEAKPILQWDREDQRNPFSWYVYQGGSRPEQWGLHTGTWAAVTGVTLQPSMWTEQEQFSHQGQSALFVLDGARDSRESGLGLFPEILQASLHNVRSVIEAYSNTQQLEGREEASACGLCIGQPGSANQIRVTTATGVAVYHIDRWD